MRSRSNTRLPLAAVDLEAVVVLAAGREARAFERADRAVLEAHERERRVVDVDRRLSCRIARAAGAR